MKQALALWSPPPQSPGKDLFVTLDEPFLLILDVVEKVLNGRYVLDFVTVLYVNLT